MNREVNIYFIFCSTNYFSCSILPSNCLDKFYIKVFFQYFMFHETFIFTILHLKMKQDMSCTYISFFFVLSCFAIHFYRESNHAVLKKNQQ